MPEILVIAAIDRDGGLGRDGQLLFRIPEDLQRFKALTLGHPVVMGRKTWQSIGRPLPGRRNVVVSRDPAFAVAGVEVVTSLDAALTAAAGASRIAVIGGAELYAAALPIADRLELTEIDATAPADTRFPAWNAGEWNATGGEVRTTADGTRYRFVSYVRRRPGASRDGAPPRRARPDPPA